VRSAPARIRQVRVGENPWYEVVLTEGRNRELRKMFAGVGHFAEKIRRVGYGPLVLDVEPGKLRELTADEVNALRLTAEGKMKPRRVKVDRVLPKEAGRGSEKRGERPAQPWRNRPTGKRFDAARERAPGRGGRPFRQQEERGQRRDFRPSGGEFRGRHEGGAFRGGGPRGGEKPGFGRRQDQPFGAARPRFDKPGFEKRSFDGPRSEKPGFSDRPGGQTEGRREDAPRTPFRAQGERQFSKQGDRPKKRFEGTRPPFHRDGEGKRRDEITKRAGGESGKNFGKGAKFGAKPGGFGKSRGDGERGSKSGFSRPGAQRGGWKRRG
jgi:23S rRNA pseudouridine2605 synthase